MSDPAHKATDKEIERLEKKIKKEYAKALDELKDKASAHFARFEEQDNRKRGELEMGYISKSEYYAWRQSQMAAGKRYETLIKDMAETLVNADKIATGMIGERIPEVYAINSNYAAYEICEGTGANISFDLYDRNTAERLIDDPIFYPRLDIEKDERWNEKKVRSALLQGILQGDSVLKIANRLKQVTNMDDAAAVRNARTFCTRAQNAGRNDRYKEVEEKYGLHFEKEWISTDDNRTRDTHKDKSEGGVGGEVVGLDEEFSNKLQYPGDPAGDPSEVYNCRCTMRSIYRGKKKDAQEEFGKFDTDTTFEEYQKQNDFKPDLGNVVDFYGKEKTIEALEQMNPEEGRVWNDYINNANYKLITEEESETAFHTKGTKDVNLFDYSSEYTFFHETAHSMDDGSIVGTVEITGKRKKIMEDGWVETTPYTYEINSASRAAQEIYDINEHAWSEDNAAFMKWANMKDEDDIKALIEAVKTFRKEYGEEATGILGDMIDAHTLGKYPMSVFAGGHGAEYWKGDASLISIEGWAEVSTLKAKGRQDVVDALVEILPNRVKSEEKIYNIIFKGAKDYEHKTIDKNDTRISETIWRFKRKS